MQKRGARVQVLDLAKTLARPKRSISNIVATVLIILITVAAVAIIWMVIAPMLKGKLSSTTTTGQNDLMIENSQGYTVYDPNSPHKICVQVKRGNDNDNITGVQFVFGFNGSSTTADSDTAPLKNGAKTYCFPITEKPTSISIAPIFSINGEKVVGDKTSTITDIKTGDLSSVPITGPPIIPPSGCTPVCPDNSTVTCGQSVTPTNSCSSCSGAGTKCSAGLTCNPVSGSCAAPCTPMTCLDMWPQGYFLTRCGSGLPDGCGGTIDCPGDNCNVGVMDPSTHKGCNATGWCVSPVCKGTLVCSGISDPTVCAVAGCFSTCSGSNFDCNNFSHVPDGNGDFICPTGCTKTEFCGTLGENQNFDCNSVLDMNACIDAGCQFACGGVGLTFHCTGLNFDECGGASAAGCLWNGSSGSCIGLGGSCNVLGIYSSGSNQSGICVDAGCQNVCAGPTKSCSSIPSNNKNLCSAVGCNYDGTCTGTGTCSSLLSSIGDCYTSLSGCSANCTSSGSESCIGLSFNYCNDLLGQGCTWSI